MDGRSSISREPNVQQYKEVVCSCCSSPALYAKMFSKEHEARNSDRCTYSDMAISAKLGDIGEVGLFVVAALRMSIFGRNARCPMPWCLVDGI